MRFGMPNFFMRPFHSMMKGIYSMVLCWVEESNYKPCIALYTQEAKYDMMFVAVRLFDYNSKIDFWHICVQVLIRKATSSPPVRVL